MSEDTHPRDTTIDHGEDRASGEVRSDAAGSKSDPPATGDVDQAAVDAGRERLDQAGGGH